MEKLPRSCVFAVLAVCVGCLSDDVSRAQTPPIRPSKIAVRVPPRAFGVGDEANLLIGLMDANNEVAEATKAVDVMVECTFPSGKTKSWKVHFNPGESSQRLHVPLLERGAVEITAKHRELMEGGNLLNVMEERPAAILPKHPVRGEHIAPEAQPGAPPAPTTAGESASPSAQTFKLGPGTGGGRGPASLTPEQSAEERSSESAPPADAEQAAGSGGPPHWHPMLSLKEVPRRKIWADEKDTATIYAYLGPNDIAKWDMYIYLVSTNGKITPNPLIIPKGQSLTTASLVSDRPEPASVEFVNSTPWAKLVSGHKINVNFTPAVTHFKLKASPPMITLFEQTELVVELMDAQLRKTATDDARSISFAMENGSGQFQNTEVVVPSGHYEGRTVFFPTSPGQINISASTASLPEETIAIRVTLPVTLAVVSLVGGCLGGVLAYWAGRRTKLRRIVIGVITGFVLYWGFLFGVLPLLPHFPHAFVLNPFTALVLTILGGWLGTQVFTPVMKRFGL